MNGRLVFKTIVALLIALWLINNQEFTFGILDRIVQIAQGPNHA